MLTEILHAPLSLLASAITGFCFICASSYMFISYHRTRNEAVLAAGIFFTFISLRCVCFVVPYFIDASNMLLFAYAYIIGTTLTLCALMVGFRLLRLMASSIISEKEEVLGIITVGIITIFSTALLFYDFRLPVVNELGVMTWVANPIVRWLVGLTFFIYGYLWGVIFYEAAMLLKDSYGRFKLLTLSAVGFLLGTAGFLIHISINSVQNLLGLSLAVLAGSITLLMYLLPKRFFTQSKH